MRKISLKEKNYKLALGTVNFGLKYGIKSNSKVSFKDIKKIIITSFNNKINYIDTSQAYNNAEKILGKFNLKKFNIITKIKFYKKNISFPEEETFAKVNKSLKDLNISKIYALLIHDYKDCTRPNSKKVFNVLKKLKKMGKIKNIGISINSPKEYYIAKKFFKFDIVQCPLNLFDRRLVSSGLKEDLRKNKIKLIVRSIFLQGLLLLKMQQKPKFFINKKLWFNWHTWLKKNKIKNRDAALNYILQNINKNDIILSGVDSATQLKQILNTKVNLKMKIPKNLSTKNTKILEPSKWDIK